MKEILVALLMIISTSFTITKPIPRPIPPSITIERSISLGGMNPVYEMVNGLQALVTRDGVPYSPEYLDHIKTIESLKEAIREEK